MNRHISLCAGLLALFGVSASSLPGTNDASTWVASPPNAILPSHSTPQPLDRQFARLALSFESNQGQANSKVRFLSHTGNNTLFLTPTEAVFVMPARSVTASKTKYALRAVRHSVEKGKNVALRMQMVGANMRATALELQPLEGRVSYFIGNDPSKWHANVPTYRRVGFHGVYPGVDLVYYGNQRHLEYDFVVAPHADPEQIQLHFAGADGVHIDAAGDLLVRTQGRELKWRKPAVYQQDEAGKHAVTAHFRQKTLPNGQAGVSFALGRYNTARPLIIDPVLLYSLLSSLKSPGIFCLIVS